MFKPSRFSNAARCLLAAVVFVIVAASAHAQNRALDAPRSAGTVGERYDGYAMLRDAGSAAALQTLVDQVNAERRKVYSARAQKEKAPIDQIGRVYAVEIFRSAPAGTWFLREDGTWTRK